MYLHSSAGRYGADLQLALIVEGLDRSLWTPLCVLPERGALADLLEERGAEVVVRDLAVLRRAELSPRAAAGFVGRVRADRGALGDLAREREVALVHSNTSVVLSGGAVARRAGAPHLMHVREIFEGAGGAFAERAWPALRTRIERADALACVSDAVLAQFPRAAAADRAFVLHDGLPSTADLPGRARAREGLALDTSAFVALVTGRINDWKGQDALALALAEPGLEDAVGLVAGDAWPGQESYEEELRRLAADLGLGGRFRLLGFRDDLRDVLAAADAAVVTSLRPDPLPNSALEAASAGVAVIATAHGGLPDIVRDGVTGVLIPPGDRDTVAAALAEALRGLIADRARAAEMGAAAARDVRERFDPALMHAALNDRYERLASR